MGALITLFLIAALLFAAALQWMGQHRLACWLLAAFPLFTCLACLRDLAQGASRIGLATYQSDQKQLGVALLLLAVSILAALRPHWRWLFWIEWILLGVACGVLVYLAFFWKVFS